MTATSVRIARPRFFLDGQESAALADGLQELAVREDWQGLASCTATFGNWGNRNGSVGLLYDDRRALDFGKALEVRFDDARVFVGVVMAIEGSWSEAAPPRCTVFAEDRLQDLRMTRRTRSFTDSRDAEIVQQVAREHGLATDVQVEGGSFAHVAQLNQSDLAFLRERGRAAGFEVWVDDRTLHAASRPNRVGAAVTLVMGQTLRELRVRADLAGQQTKVQVGGFDVASRDGIAVEVGDDSLAASELGSDESGAALLASARGARVTRIVHELPATAAEARARAQAWFQARARRFVTGEGRSDADARLRVGATVDLKGVGTTFEGKYSLVEVVHRFDATNGLRSEFLIERCGVGRKA